MYLLLVVNTFFYFPPCIDFSREIMNYDLLIFFSLTCVMLQKGPVSVTRQEPLKISLSLHWTLFLFLPPGGYALRTWIRTTLHHSSILVENNALSISHHRLPVITYLNLVAQSTQRLYSFWQEAALYKQRFAPLVRSMYPARHLDSLLHIQTKTRHRRIHLQMRLSLTIASHSAKNNGGS